MKFDSPFLDFLLNATNPAKTEPTNSMLNFSLTPGISHGTMRRQRTTADEVGLGFPVQLRQDLRNYGGRYCGDARDCRGRYG